ncbi:MAG: tetratricopeptide repeat protein [Flavobacteriales bacterium]|nr:tetratricopeptide repeat protein [Flavobacteriales bacterium]
MEESTRKKNLFIFFGSILVIVFFLVYILNKPENSGSNETSVQSNLRSTLLEVIRNENEISKTKDYVTYINLGLAYYNDGQLFKAIQAWEEAIKLKETAKAHSNICSAYCRMGLGQEALKHCNRALAIEPENDLAANNKKWAENILERDTLSSES